MSWAVVVPTCRPDRLDRFRSVWAALFDRHGVELIVVRDEPATWEQLPGWVPRQSDAIRSWGFVEAYRSGASYIATLDDDVVPIDNVDPFAEYEAVFERGAPCSPYVSVGALTSSPYQMRGFPLADRRPARVAVQYGGWWGVPDYDAVTQLTAPVSLEEWFVDVALPVPRGVPATTCIMNAAWRRDVTPIMWQLPIVEGRFNRWGDIWSGLLQKAALDAAREVMVINGRASVQHERASDPVTNLRRELPGIAINEALWSTLRWAIKDDLGLLEAWLCATLAFADILRMHDEDAWADTFLWARDAWLDELRVTR